MFYNPTKFISYLLIFFILLVTSQINGQQLANKESAITSYDTLAGPLSKIIKAQAKPYLVTADIEIPSNRVVTIEPGVVLLFKNFTGLHVSGKLVALGTEDKPIVFTSENNREYNPLSTLYPNPFDWNGIYIHDDAFGTMMTHCQVSYTVYGLISDTKYIKLDPVSFKENGKSSLIIVNEKQPVTDKPFSYVLSIKDATIDGIQIDLLKDPVAPRRNFLRYSGLASAIGGIGAGIYYTTKFKNSWKAWENINGQNQDISTLQRPPSHYDNLKENKDRDLFGVCLGLGIGLLGVIGFTWSFTF